MKNLENSANVEVPGGALAPTPVSSVGLTFSEPKKNFPMLSQRV